jgi:tripartite ATP-independent transporter DctP family solute receptor
MKRTFMVTLILALAAATVLFGAGNAGPATVVFKLADNQPLESPLAAAMVRFGKIVAEKSGGSIKIEVYPNAQLGEEAEITEQVAAGVMDLARINVIQLSTYLKDYDLFTLPYIFSDDAHKWKVLDGEIAKKIDAKLAKKANIEVLGYLDSGWRCFYTKKPVRVLVDMRGMKIRVMDSAANIQMIKLLGATPTPMPYADVFTALQTGVIDGAENDYVSYKSSGHYEVAKNYVLDRHTAGLGVLVMSGRVRKKLNARQRKIIDDAAREAIAWQRKAMGDKEDECRNFVVKSGTVITKTNVAEFQKAVAPMYKQYAEYESTIAKIKALGQ